MNLLLDTHAFVWWVTDDPRLPTRARRAIADPRNDIFVSAITVWEIVIKRPLGKIQIAHPERTIAEHIRENAFAALPLHIPHALRVANLPDIHSDPFDRLLIAQAIHEGAAIVTGDRAIKRYPVDVRW